MKENVYDKLEKEFQKRYDQLQIDKDLFRISFPKTKKCGCKRKYCRHFKVEYEKEFGDRINKNLAFGIAIRAYAMSNAMPETSEACYGLFKEVLNDLGIGQAKPKKGDVGK